ncbi:Amino acid permease [Vanrija albida]|uniref:Amino acid permease n=1 Tax=Vanrija albida TaxID=181172 RepID=A0ABR3QFZ0_9TREE
MFDKEKHPAMLGHAASGSPPPSTPASVKVKEPSFSEWYDPSKESKWTRLGLTPESFKRAPGATRGLVTHGDIPEEFRTQDNPLLQQQMKPRHLQMIAVGGSIGTGLFVGSGTALQAGGPAGVLIAWISMGIMLVNVTQALGEMSILYPVSGGFYTLASRMLDPSFACAMGWNYTFQWLTILPLELTVAGMTVQYWTNAVPLGAWITIFYVFVIFICLFGTLGYAEGEFWSSVVKLALVVIFAIIGIVCICGGGPKNGAYSEYVGGKYWQDPGAFANGFKGVCAMFVTAAFSYSGTELVGLAATETPNPRETMPSAIKNTFWRVTLVYITSLVIIGLALPYNEPLLNVGTGAQISPFTIVMKKAGFKGLDHLVNATICVSVLSMGLSATYGGSRCMMALAEQGYGPKFLTYVDKAGRPLYAVLLVIATGPLAYINLAPVGDLVFQWLMALSGLSTLFTWLAICITHIRFRRAWKLQGHSIEELPFKAMGGTFGSWMGATLIVFIICVQFYVAVWPIGEQPHGRAAAEQFFLAFLAMPIMIFIAAVSYIWKRDRPRRAADIDLDTGRKSWLTVEEMRAYRAERAAAPWYTRLYRLLFTN